MLSTTTNYAIRAVAYLVSVIGNGPADSRQISQATGIPRRFLLKILHTLTMHNYLVSVRGIGGGFSLSKPPESIHLYEVAELFEDLKRFSICPFGSGGCLKAEQCPLHEGWSSARVQFVQFLQEMTFKNFTKTEFRDCFPKTKS